VDQLNQLTANLLDLLHELDGRDIPIMVGGGFGLYLKRQHLDAIGYRTLFDLLPEPRSTNDLDLFLSTEVLIDLERTREVAEAIRRLGYTVVEAAKFLQWRRKFTVSGVPREVKIDILVGPLGDSRKKLNVTMPRVRPKGKIEFHAHAVEEAICIDDAPLAVTVAGKGSTGEPRAGTVHIPQAFPYLMMKLHAFDDRRKKAETEKDDQKKKAETEKVLQQALDLYTIVGMMTEEEYERAKELGAANARDEHVKRARAIVRDHFGGWTAIGVLRLRNHERYREGFLVDEFISVLAEIFPTG
jgi:hypothetical protein